MYKKILKLKDFNLKYSYESGQPLAFYGKFSNNAFSYITKEHFISIEQKRKSFILESDSIKFAKHELTSRFRLKDNMPEIYSKICTDKFMKNAVTRYKGLHITLNDPWETLVVFIISQNNNLKRIRGSTLYLINKFGKYTDFGKGFPSIADFSNAKAADFQKAGLGFRSRYLLNAIDYCTNNINLYSLKSKSYADIKNELVEIIGVGNKIADCVALMGYGKLEAFPIDVWIKRALETLYFKAEPQNIKDLQSFAMQKWGKYAGYAQQYIYWAAKNNNF